MSATSQNPAITHKDSTVNPLLKLMLLGNTKPVKIAQPEKVSLEILKITSATGQAIQLELPPEYQIEADGSIMLKRSSKPPELVAPRPMVVIAEGEDINTGKGQVTVRFETINGSLREHTVPVQALADGRELVNTLACFDAPIIGGVRASRMVEYLERFRTVNQQRMTRTRFTDRLGWQGNGLVGPGWEIGGAPHYTGTFSERFKLGVPNQIYIDTLKEVATWGSEAWVLWLALGLALVSPIMALHKPLRNPVVWLHGDSGKGKTTVARLAGGLFLNPHAEPFTIQGSRQTSPKGLLQTLEQLGGFPGLLDETHLTDPDLLESLVYLFANGQSYTRGGKDGTPRPNPDLRGVLFLAGEAPPSFANVGSRNRAMMIDIERYPPLGKLDAPERAELLQRAYSEGSGVFGRQVLELILENSVAFTDQVRDLEKSILAIPEIAESGREWARTLAWAQAAINQLWNAAGLKGSPINVVTKALQALGENKKTQDPARDAMHGLVSCLLSAESRGVDDNQTRWMRGEMLARFDGKNWIIPRDNKALIGALEQWGGTQAVKTHAAAWVKRGWLESDAAGKSTQTRSIGGGKVRALVLTQLALDIGGESE